MGDRRVFERFRLLTEVEGGQPVQFYAPECDRCNFPTKIRFTGKRLPPEALLNILRKRGWDAGNSLVCPRCKEGKRPMSPAARRAAFCAISKTKRADEARPAPIEEVPVMAEPPRVPTPEERRRIRDALDEHYLEDKACYSKSWSDKALAAKLAMPTKWVSDLREANGLGPDASEAAAQHAAAVEAVAARLAEVQADLLKQFDQIEKEVRKLQIDQSYAA